MTDGTKFGSHAWLERGSWIVDITADQFPDVTESVIVTQDRDWYNRYVHYLDSRNEVA